MHRLLQRQIKRYLGDTTISPELAVFLQAVDQSYQQADDDRQMMERSLDLASQELTDAHSSMRALFAQLVNSSSDGIFAFDGEYRITVWNAALEQITGVAMIHAIGKSVFALFPKLTSTNEHLKMAEALEGHMALVDSHTALIPRNQRHRTFESHYAPIRNDAAAIIGGLAMIRDVTEQKLAYTELVKAKESAEAATRAKSAFLATMSHEIRTPLNGIIGMNSLLLETPLTHEQYEYAETTRKSGESLLAIINDILDFSKIEAGKTELEQIDFNLSEVLEEALDFMAHDADRKGLTVGIVIDPTLPRMVQGDPYRLRQVVLNLLSNAIKFSTQGEIVVSVMPYAIASGVGLRIEVQDQGIGLPEDAQQRLFQPFVQVDGSTTRFHGGTGLGLAICRQLVSLMEGNIGARNAPGGGSIFWFTVKLGHAEHRLLPLEAESIDMTQLHALIVGKTPGEDGLLARMLTSWNITANAVVSRNDALEQLAIATTYRRPYTLVLIDLQALPNDGYDLARDIQANPDLQSVGMILLAPLTQLVPMSSSHNCKVLAKPLRQSKLYNCILSLHYAHQNTARQAPVEPTLVPQQRSNARILIVEDNLVNQRVALRMIEKLGYQADVVANGREALDILERIHYDLILMDCHMPIMDGFTTTQQIRERNTNEHRVPIIALTANAIQGEYERCIMVGMDDYMTKPVQFSVLAETIERWLTKPLPQDSFELMALSQHEESGLDMQVLADLRASDISGETLNELKDLLIEHSLDALAQIEIALELGKHEPLIQLGHSLKGSSSMLGASRLSGLWAAIERGGLQHDLVAITYVLPQIKPELDRVNQQFAVMLASA